MSNGSGDPDKARLRAERQFAQAEAGAQARAEHDAAAKAVEEKTVRLKALRLAKEAAEKEMPVKKPAKKSSKT